MNMELNELFLRTAFACMACDGDIAQEEVDLIKNLIGKNTYLAISRLTRNWNPCAKKSMNKERDS